MNLSITESTFGERSFKRSDGHGFFTFKEIDPEYNDEIKLFPLKQKNKCNQSYIDLQKKKHYAILWDMHPNLNISELLNVSFDKNDIKQIQEDFKGIWYSTKKTVDILPRINPWDSLDYNNITSPIGVDIV